MNFFKIKLFFLLLIPFSLNSQNCNLDSLKNLLNHHIKEDTIKVELLKKIAYNTYMFDIEEAVGYIHEAKRISEKNNYKRGIAESLRVESLMESHIGGFQNALELLYDALKISEKGNFLDILPKIYNDLGVIYLKLDDTEKSLQFFNDALKFYKSNNVERGVASCYNNLGLLHKKVNNYSDALECYKSAYKIYSNMQYDLGMTVTLLNIGVIYKKFKDYEQSINYYNRSLEISKKINDLEGIGASYNNIGEVLFIKKEYNKALDYTFKSIEIAKNNNYLLLLSKTYRQLSNIYLAKKEYFKAYENYKNYKLIDDSVFSISTIKKISDIENKYKYEKKLEIEEIEKNKEVAIRKEKENRRKFILYSVIFGFVLLALFTTYIFYLLIQKHRANKILIAKKEEIDLLNEELISTNKILAEQKAEINTTLDKLKSTQSQLLQKEKMASIGILTSGVAHEINNPLNFILGGYAGIKKYFKSNNIEDNNMKYFLISLETGIERISKIVKGLTKFSSNKDNNNLDCNIHAIIDNCLLMLNNQLNDKIKIEKLFSSDNVIVKCNEGDLHQVFINVFLNAIQSISKKGEIKITTKIVNGNIEIKISDTGSGIKTEDVEKVLDPFFTTKDPGKGTGLGLSIVYTIVKEHKGDIKINSEENIGTSVIIKLPAKN